MGKPSLCYREGRDESEELQSEAPQISLALGQTTNNQIKP